MYQHVYIYFDMYIYVCNSGYRDICMCVCGLVRACWSGYTHAAVSRCSIKPAASYPLHPSPPPDPHTGDGQVLSKWRGCGRGDGRKAGRGAAGGTQRERKGRREGDGAVSGRDCKGGRDGRCWGEGRQVVMVGQGGNRHQRGDVKRARGRTCNVGMKAVHFSFSFFPGFICRRG